MWQSAKDHTMNRWPSLIAASLLAVTLAMPAEMML
jgi:hypothetical protein